MIMERSIKGTRTEQNLLKSFAGESQARSRYIFFASKAKKEGYEQIAGVFAETAEQEKEHAERFFKFLEGGMVEITASFPAGVIGTTIENLAAAAAGENEEWTELYPAFADIAEEEGFRQIAVAWRMIAKVEAEHERRYRKLLDNLEKGQVFRKDEEIEWQCRNCGYVHTGKTAPGKCPACEHPQAYFEPKKQNY
jgi:rubrerythrin